MKIFLTSSNPFQPFQIPKHYPKRRNKIVKCSYNICRSKVAKSIKVISFLLPSAIFKSTKKNFFINHNKIHSRVRWKVGCIHAYMLEFVKININSERNCFTNTPQEWREAKKVFLNIFFLFSYLTFILHQTQFIFTPSSAALPSSSSNKCQG